LREVGYVVAPSLVSASALVELRTAALDALAARAPPLEFEADLQYPGAPSSRLAAGGQTVRRLLDAYARDPAFAKYATAAVLRDWMETYFDEQASMSRVHHNCLMTKHPLYGSLTGWHRDMRYWAFAREDLVSVWLALGEERIDNGALWFVPGSHRAHFEAHRYDDAKFFRADHADNAAVLRAAESPHLDPGDAVFFHCNTLHSAGKNLSDEVKLSLVYSYHGRSNTPSSGTRSALRPEVPLDEPDQR
jgi:phytanoyl-CoA hydroxylase